MKRYQIDVLLVDGRQVKFSYSFELQAKNLDQAKDQARRKLHKADLTLRSLNVRSGEPCKLLAYARKERR